MWQLSSWGQLDLLKIYSKLNLSYLNVLVIKVSVALPTQGL